MVARRVQHLQASFCSTVVSKTKREVGNKGMFLLRSSVLIKQENPFPEPPDQLRPPTRQGHLLFSNHPARDCHDGLSLIRAHPLDLSTSLLDEVKERVMAAEERPTRPPDSSTQAPTRASFSHTFCPRQEDVPAWHTGVRPHPRTPCPSSLTTAGERASCFLFEAQARQDPRRGPQVCPSLGGLPAQTDFRRTDSETGPGPCPSREPAAAAA